MLIERSGSEPGRCPMRGGSHAAAVATQTTPVPLVSAAPKSNGDGTHALHAAQGAAGPERSWLLVGSRAVRNGHDVRPRSRPPCVEGSVA